MSAVTLALAYLFGWFAWTFDEYLMHRFAMHEMRGRGLASREHLTHHAERDSILEKWPIAWSGIITVGVFGLRPLGGWALDRAHGVALAAGFIGGYGFYDLMHYRAHRHPVRTKYERWLRRHHFHHHFGHPMRNHGVTHPLFDLLFGTYDRVDAPVRVPQRLAMVWLTDASGKVRPEYAADYQLTADQRTEDRRRAFANLAPSV